MITPCLFRPFIGITLLIGFAGNIHAQQQGAETPEQLLKRVAEGIRTRNLEQLMTCLPTQKNEKEKAAATAVAKNLLLHTDVKKFGKAGKARYGDQFRQIIGLRAYFIMVSIGAMDFQAFTKDAKIEVDDEANTAVVAHGEGVGKMTLNLVRQNGRWFLETHLGLQPDSKSTPELQYQAAERFVRTCREALEESNSQSGFQKRVEKASKKYQAAVQAFK